jgi:hypothetical protein
MNKKIGLLGIIMILMIGVVHANELVVDINQPLFIKMVCAGTAPTADIQIYSGTTMTPDNIVVLRTPMDQLSAQDFEYTATFSAVGTYTAFEECNDGGFISTQTTTITVTDPTNLITPVVYKDYQYGANLFYDVYFKENPTLPNTIDFILGTNEITIQPTELSLGVKKKSQDINPLPVIGSPVGNNFVYSGIYGTGLDLQYLVNRNYVKEEMVINDITALPVPGKELAKEFAKHPAEAYIELNSLMNLNGNHLIVDGKEWDMKKPISTSNLVLVQDDLGNTIYQLQIPVAFDTNGNKVIGKYIFTKIEGEELDLKPGEKKKEKHNSLISIAVQMPYSWFTDVNRAYPVYIDPTVDTPDGTGVFDNSVPAIVIAPSITIPAGIPYMITETIMKGTTQIVDAECELDIIDDVTQVKVVDFRSFFNNQGTYEFIWDMPYVGSFTVDQYCWHGDTLVLNKIFSISTIAVI